MKHCPPCTGNCNQGRNCDSPPVSLDAVGSVALWIMGAITLLFAVCLGAWLYAAVWPVVRALI